MMLGVYSSGIVRSVGCAALMLLLAATTCPTFGAPTGRAVESLSAAERASLPDGTLIKFKTGRTVSLGVLRSEHKLRLQRFADAAKIGKQRVLLATHGGVALSIAGSTQPTLVPMDLSLQDFKLVPGYPLPADFLAFCKAAVVTACLYLPETPYLYFCCNGAFDSDPLLTDQQLCNSEGGQLIPAGCSWDYPTTYKMFFNPGPPTAQGFNNVTSSAPSGNNSRCGFTVDPHGVVTLSYNTSTINNQGGAFVLEFCEVSVFVKK